MQKFLKVKVSSLAAEARIIRRLESARARYLKAMGRPKGEDAEYCGLKDHRRRVVRRETRHSHLAYGFLRGRPYRVMDAKTWTNPDWDAVERMVVKFGGEPEPVLKQRFAAWKDEGLQAAA